jgi:hypothetical protein
VPGRWQGGEGVAGDLPVDEVAGDQDRPTRIASGSGQSAFRIGLVNRWGLSVIAPPGERPCSP